LAAVPHTPEGFEALESILARYRPALIAHIRAKFGCSLPDAEDHLHNFIEAKVLRKNCLAGADRTRGRFRTFLFAILDRFVISQYRRQNALKRSIDLRALPIHEISEEQLPRADDSSSDQSMMVWFQGALAGALLNMQNDLLASGRSVSWRLFTSRVLMPAITGERGPEYDQFIALHEIDTPINAFNLIVSARRMYKRHLFEVLSEYIKEPEELGEEYDDFKALIARLRRHSSRR
jgi:RNA polymerase sigma-70 factor (ECF subfamily)